MEGAIIQYTGQKTVLCNNPGYEIFFKWQEFLNTSAFTIENRFIYSFITVEVVDRSTTSYKEHSGQWTS